MTGFRTLVPFSAFFLLILSGAGALALTVPETPPSAWNQGSLGVQTSSDYFTSHANFGETRGSYDRLINGNQWTSFENRIKGRYGFSPTTSLFIGMGANAATATDTGLQKNNSAPTEVFAGMDFTLARRWWRVVPEIEASYALDNATRGQTSPLTSDGASYARAGVFMFKPYRYFRFEGYLGFHIPGNQLATRFLYNLGTEVAMFGAFTAGAAIQGFESVLSDTSSDAERKFTQATADATSERFWAYNPALLEAKAWIGLRFDRSFGIRLGYAKTLNGVRMAEGQSFLLSLFYNSPGNPRVSSGSVPHGAPSVQVGEKQIAPRSHGEGFRTEPEPNDPELFDQQNENPLDNTERLFDHH